MMKRKILAVTIPVVGCLTVVGSGFSAWYFGEKIDTGSNGQSIVNVNVTEEVKASQGELTINTSGTNLGTTLILDQGGPKNYSLDSGIMFGESTAKETTVNTDAKWHFTVTFTGYQEGDQKLTLDKIYDAGLQVRISAEISLGGNLKDYVEFKDNLTLSVTPTGDGQTVRMDKNEDGTKLQGEYIVTDANAGNVQTAVWTFEMTAKTTKSGDNYSNELLRYKASSGANDEVETTPTGKPNATGEPEKMGLALADAKITFNVTARIEDNPNK